MGPEVRQFVDDDSENRRRGNREDGAQQAPELAADEQRNDDGDRADADAALHDLGDENVGLELVQHQEVDADRQRQPARHAHARR